MNKLITPCKIKSLVLKNRLVMPPMATAKTKNGEITDDLITYYDQKTADEALGLVIMEHSYVHIDGKASHHQVSIADDEQVKGLKCLVDTVHKNNTPIFAQINHAGSKGISEKRLSASRIQYPNKTENAILPDAMTLDDIDAITQAFVDAAQRAKAAGFDGVELHSAHGYLLNQFYSPLTNQREDHYGGDVLARIQLHLDIIQRIRDVLGKDYPIAMRLGACDDIEGGSTIDDAITAARAFEKAGIDLLDISGGLLGYTRPHYKEEGYFSDITQKLKEIISIPVLLTGGIITPKSAEYLLCENCADLIGVGRAILKDDHWAKRCILDLQ